MTGRFLCSVSHNEDEPLAVQDYEVQKMRHPAQVSTYIKQQHMTALAGVRGYRPDKALLGFYASMEHLCSIAGPLMNYINLSAIITAIAVLWSSVQANSSFKPSANMIDFAEAEQAGNSHDKQQLSGQRQAHPVYLLTSGT